MRRRLELHRRFALHQIVRVGFHRGKLPHRIGSGEARDPFQSRPPQDHGLLGFAQVGAQGQTIERGIGRMNHQRNVVRGPVRLRQNQAVAARAPCRRIHFRFHALLVALGLALGQIKGDFLGRCLLVSRLRHGHFLDKLKIRAGQLHLHQARALHQAGPRIPGRPSPC